jgi:hypothetical protein
MYKLEDARQLELAEIVCRKAQEKLDGYKPCRVSTILFHEGIHIDEVVPFIDALKEAGFSYDTDGVWGPDQLLSRMQTVVPMWQEPFRTVARY